MGNEEKKERLSKNLAVFKTALKLLVISASIYIATVAWFINNENATIDLLEISVNKIKNVQVSLDGGTSWNSSASIELDENFRFNNEVTSDGISFYKANAKTLAGNPINFIPAVVNEDYLEFTLMFKSDVSVGILLDDSSLVYPAAGKETSDVIGTDVTRLSAGGNFSRDLIAGAVRVAFVANDPNTSTPTSTTSMVWAPNKGYELLLNNGSYTATLNSTNQQNYNYINVTSPYVFAEAPVKHLKEDIRASKVNNDDYGDPVLTYLELNEGEEEVIGSITVRIWVEGNDRETITPLRGGLFKLSLQFVVLEKKLNNNIPEVSADTVNNTINNYDLNMEYSTNYGRTWIKYSSNNAPTFNEGDVVCVRYHSTASTFASDWIELLY